MRTLNGFLLLFFVLLQLCLWVGQGSVGHIVALDKKIEQQQSLNQKLAERNARVTAEVLSFQQGHDSVEEYARSQLGMIKPDETFFLVVNHQDDRQ